MDKTTETFWVIGHRQLIGRDEVPSEWVTVFGSRWGLRRDPKPGSKAPEGARFSTPEKAIAHYNALEPDMMGRTGNVYEVTPTFRYVAGPLIENGQS